MRFRPESGRSLDSVVLLFLLGMFLFVSPFTAWWAANTRVWFLPYLLWFGQILLIAWVVHRRREDV
jgi:hypothetical protein